MKKGCSGNLTVGLLSQNFSTLGKEIVKEDDINNMDFFESCKYLNLNRDLLVHHFQYRVEIFFKKIVVDGPLEKVKYHVIRIGFQLGESPHIHLFSWITDVPVQSKVNFDEYIMFIESVVKAFVPNPIENTKLFHLVKIYQVHSHSKSCRNFKSERC